MKTKLPTKLTTISDVENFITELYSNDEFFHLDDDAAHIVNIQTGERLFTDDEAQKINTLLEQAFTICEVWELPVVFNIVDSICTKLNEL